MIQSIELETDGMADRELKQMTKQQPMSSGGGMRTVEDI